MVGGPLLKCENTVAKSAVLMQFKNGNTEFGFEGPLVLGPLSLGPPGPCSNLSMLAPVE